MAIVWANIGSVQFCHCPSHWGFKTCRGTFFSQMDNKPDHASKLLQMWGQGAPNSSKTTSDSQSTPTHKAGLGKFYQGRTKMLKHEQERLQVKIESENEFRLRKSRWTLVDLLSLEALFLDLSIWYKLRSVRSSQFE